MENKNCFFILVLTCASLYLKASQDVQDGMSTTLQNVAFVKATNNAVKFLKGQSEQCFKQISDELCYGVSLIVNEERKAQYLLKDTLNDHLDVFLAVRFLPKCHDDSRKCIEFEESNNRQFFKGCMLLEQRDVQAIQQKTQSSRLVYSYAKSMAVLFGKAYDMGEVDVFAKTFITKQVRQDPRKREELFQFLDAATMYQQKIKNPAVCITEIDGEPLLPQS